MSIAYTYVLTDGAQAQLLAPTTETASGNTAAVAIQPAKGDALAILNVGTPTGTSPTLSAQLESSPDGTTWTAVGAPLAPAAAGIYSVAFRPNDATGTQFRWALTLGGTSPSFPLSSELIYWPAKN